VADQNIATLEQHHKDVSSRIRAGVATKFDLLRVEVLLEDAKIAKLSAEDDKIISRKKLWQALGVADDGRALAGRLPESWDALPSDLGGPKPEYRDDRRAALLLEESAAKISRAEGRFWLPTLSLFGDYDQYNNINRTLFGPNSQYNDAYALGLALSWNLFDGGHSWAERAQANVRAEKASLRMKEIDDALPVDFELWRRRYVYSVAAFEAKKVAVRKAEESIRIAKTSARAGTRTNTEVLDAVRDLNEEKAKLVQAQVEAIEALGNLELAYGRPLRGVSVHAKGGEL
jgi:outer membrane protein TolC